MEEQEGVFAVKFSNLPKGKFMEHLFMSQLRGKLQLKRRARNSDSTSKDIVSCVHDKVTNTVTVSFGSYLHVKRILETKMEFLSTTLLAEELFTTSSSSSNIYTDDTFDAKCTANGDENDHSKVGKHISALEDDDEYDVSMDTAERINDVSEDFNSPVKKKIDMRSTPRKLKSESDGEKNVRSNLNNFFSNLSFIPKLSKKVQISDLPTNFDEKNVVYEANSALYKADFCKRPEKPAVACRKLDETSAVVDFTSVEAASKFSLLTVEFEGEAVKLQHIEEPISEDTTMVESLPTEYTRSVKVTELPIDFDLSNVVYACNSALYKADFYKRPEKPAVSCVKLDETSAVVDFTSVEAASKLSLLTIEYEGEAVKLQHIEEKVRKDDSIESTPQYSRSVKVTELPIDFDLSNVVYACNSALYKAGCYMRPEKPAVSCLKLDETSAVVDFTSVEAASKFTLLTIEYEGEAVKLQHIEEKVRSKDNSIESLTPQYTRFVKVTELPTDFDSNNVLYATNSALYKNKFCTNRTEKPATSCVKTDTTSATIEFTSVDAASVICLLSVDYEGEPLKMQQEISLASSLHDWDDGDILELSKVKCSDTVKISGIRSSYTPTTFKKFLMQEMCTANFLTEDDNSDAILECDINNDTAIVKFSTSEEATLATYLTTLNVTKILSNDNDPTCDGVDFPAGSDEDSLEQCTLKDAKGMEIFLKVLARKRDDIPKSGGHDNFLDSLISYLQKKGVTTNLNEMRSKKITMRDLHRRLVKTDKLVHPLYKVLSVIFGQNKKKDILKGSKYDWSEEDEKLLDQEPGENDFLTDLIKLSEFSSWSNNSELALAQACLDHREDYNKPKRPIHFWRTISHALYQKKYAYRPLKCEAKMEAISKDYKNRCDEADSTGAEGPLEAITDSATRKLMEVMHELKRKDLGTNPRLVQSAGAKLLYKRSKESPEKRVSRGRPSTLPRDMTAKDLRHQIELEKLRVLQHCRQQFEGGVVPKPQLK